MPGHSAVRVDNDFSARQASVGHRPADLEAPAWVDQVRGLIVQQVRGHHLPDHPIDYVSFNSLIGNMSLVLRRDHDRVDPDRLAKSILDCHLALAIRQEVVQLTGLSRLGQPPGNLVGQRDGKRHQLRSLPAGIADHHPLVTSASHVLLSAIGSRATFKRGRDPGRNLGALLLERHDHGAGAGVEAMTGMRVADLCQHFSNQ